MLDFFSHFFLFSFECILMELILNTFLPTNTRARGLHHPSCRHPIPQIELAPQQEILDMSLFI